MRTAPLFLLAVVAVTQHAACARITHNQAVPTDSNQQYYEDDDAYAALSSEEVEDAAENDAADADADTSADDDDDSEGEGDNEVIQSPPPSSFSNRPPTTQLTRKLWDCVEDNSTLSCVRDLIFEEFSAKVMDNPNVALMKRYINKYILQFMKKQRRPLKPLSAAHSSPASTSLQYNEVDDDDDSEGEDEDDYWLNERQATTTTTTVAPDADDTLRGMKQKFMDFIPYLLGPALFMAGVMPWVIPPLKMMVMFVAMLNNVAFSSALFALVRNYVFNRRQDEHVFYINHGYQNRQR